MILLKILVTIEITPPPSFSTSNSPFLFLKEYFLKPCHNKTKLCKYINREEYPYGAYNAVQDNNLIHSKYRYGLTSKVCQILD